MNPVSVEETIDKLPKPLAKVLWSNTHTTFSPNMCRAGLKTNVIPNVADIEVDIRTVPGDSEDEVRRHLGKALGDLVKDVQIEKLFSKNASSRPRARRCGTCSRRSSTGTTRARSCCRA